MKPVDWLWLLHPVLAIAVVYPLLGIVLWLARKTRNRRVLKAKEPATSGREHRDVGLWLASAVVAAELVALVVVILTKQPLAEFPGGLGRLGVLLLVAISTGVALLALLRVHQALYRLVFTLLSLVGLISLGLQPEVWRLSDNPLQAEFWQSHFWGGMGLSGLLLLSVAVSPEILKDLRWRRLHLLANTLAAVLFLAQGITGARDLLEIPLSWQKPAIASCNFQAQTCPGTP